MRIIAGEHRGRTLVPPKGNATRPITDRAKQSLFDWLSPRIEGARVYDCFSGTGSMGLECLSRGAAFATFFDADRWALDGLRKNIAALRVEERCRVLAGDLFKLMRSIEVPEAGIDLVFLDPPYRYLVERPEPLQVLSQELSRRHASPDARLIFRHDVAHALALPGWQAIETRTYGSMAIELLQPANAGASGA